ncbi:RNA-binding protein PNO1-like [Argiope bruennichi]|uniref:RNA-binding protein PNO1 like protein n=1 Tax=Argiope bruennichi TaxID=94029 RepID=A0A8T0F0S9_ARGBR|nr:RNA-binding protein PNO1-like [Argiope bruennichi]XP_055932591.1 RNA-binding protein PNO1-like [Argiope bruennichi]KAF8783437.1 RNA-binding protein PNO1 like protein [Argiope bruennichi]
MTETIESGSPETTKNEKIGHTMDSEETWSAANSKKRKSDKMEVDKNSRPHFPPAKKVMEDIVEMRKIPVPPNRYTPLRENWEKIFSTVVQHLNLHIRFNLKTRMVEIRTCKETKDISALQKAADFVRAFTLGFEVDDALALVRLDELFLESFDVKDVKTLHGDHLSRAIGRIVGKSGKTKFSIENATKTRIVVADSKIHIMGSYQNIRAARTALCNLILGSAPSKVYGNLRHVANRLAESL